MDRRNLESGNRLHRSLVGLRSLLRPNPRRAVPRHTGPLLRARIRRRDAPQQTRPAAAMGPATPDLRQLDERPLPPRNPGRLHRPRVRGDRSGPPAHLPAAHQETRSDAGTAPVRCLPPRRRRRHRRRRRSLPPHPCLVPELAPAEPVDRSLGRRPENCRPANMGAAGHACSSSVRLGRTAPRTDRPHAPTTQQNRRSADSRRASSGRRLEMRRRARTSARLGDRRR